MRDAAVDRQLANVQPPPHCYDASMRLRDAIDMLADSGVEALVPTIWADLGCGDGTFTLALADLLAPGSIIHAMDLDGSALRLIPSTNKGVGITTHRGDFMKQPWLFADLDGILMANSLHYVEHQAVFIRDCESRMKPQRRFLIVEYDTKRRQPMVRVSGEPDRCHRSVQTRWVLVDSSVAFSAVNLSARSLYAVAIGLL